MKERNEIRRVCEFRDCEERENFSFHTRKRTMLTNYIKDREKICVFKCNHIEHEYCSFNGGEKLEARKVCPICLKKEINDAETCGQDDPRFNLSYEEFKEENRQKFDLMNKRTENRVIITNYNKGFAKMKGIDNYNKKNSKKFFYDVAETCRKDYRKKAFE